MAADPTVFTPYSTVQPLWADLPQWVPEHDQERLAAYETYDKIYWSYPRVFRLSMRGTNDQPIYVPSARTIVDSTAHYLLKGLRISAGKSGSEGSLNDALAKFLKRERFLSRFHQNKVAGVTRGDWIFHMTANPALPEGRRLSLTTVDPASYFPIWDEEDPEKRIGADLVEQWINPQDNKVYVKRLRYTYQDTLASRRVLREEVILEMEGWWKGKAATVHQQIRPPLLLPEGITDLPVYHFKNLEWQGDDFGASELRGFERIMGAVNQSISDEELALALDGLGVYATDAPAPTNDHGEDIDWEVFPGSVLEIPSGTSLKRVEGVGSVKPMQDHVGFLLDQLFEASGTFRAGQISVQEAESGIALAIRFMPTLAKLEHREHEALDRLENLFFEWKRWHNAFEGSSFGDEEEIQIEIGEKLPANRTAILNELNNMLDRGVISRKFYRSEALKLGYDIPATMEEEILEEERKRAEIAAAYSQTAQDDPEQDDSEGRGPNNRRRPNESSGTEATQSLEEQATS